MTTLLKPKDLARLHAAAFRESRPWGTEEFEALLASKHCFCVGDSHGFAIGRLIAQESELLTIAVDPVSQGKGHGRLLLQHYHDEAQARGANTLFLEVAKDNTKALNLYKTMSYEVISVRAGYYKRTTGTPVDALIMQLKL
ncbi:MAG: ribosomal protein S18-alanine N-acetyltransferase [Pseudomonadota bacterium]|nr:ribosomal protein S18-alanine N-acetyltransferase [Pseudomonadota bacterium]